MGIELSKLCIANWLRREKKRVLLRRWFLSGSLINGVELDASTGLHLRPRALAPGRRRFSACGPRTYGDSAAWSQCLWFDRDYQGSSLNLNSLAHTVHLRSEKSLPPRDSGQTG